MIYIKKATINNFGEDIAEIVKLEKLCPPLDVHTYYSVFVSVEIGNAYIMYDEKKPIGFITSFLRDNCLFIWQIAVIPDYRRKRLAIKLIEKLYQEVDRPKEIKLTIADDNIASKATFEAFARNMNLTIKKEDILVLRDMEFEEIERIYIIKE